jgi:hypothetical protein
MITAIKNKSGQYELHSDKSSETFHIKDKIKALGGIWDGHYWTVDHSAIEALKIPIKHRVKVAAHCCMPEETTYAFKGDIDRGFVNCSCPMCDDLQGRDAKIIEVLD